MNKIELVHRQTTVNEGQKWTPLYTLEINSVCSSNDTMASGFSTPQFHAINDGSSVISNSIIYGVLESSMMVTIYYILLCIRVCVFLYK